MAITKLGLYNNALTTLGERTLVTDTDDTESRYRLDVVWDMNAVNYCLDLVKPHWATAVAKLSTASTSASHDLDSVHDLPNDYLSMVGLFSDANLDQRVQRYFIEDRTIACDYDPVYIRYVKDGPADSFTNWTPAVAEVVQSYLAMRIAAYVAPSRVAELETTFSNTVEVARGLEGAKEPPTRARKSVTTLSAEWLKIYNDALQILGLDEMLSADENSRARVTLDKALETDIVKDTLEEINWHFPHRTVKLDYNPSLEPEWGYPYAFDIPEDIVRLRGVFTDEFCRNPLFDYNDEDGILFAHVQTIYLNYIPDDDLDNPAVWTANFKRLIAASMAVQAGPTLRKEGADVENARIAHFERMSRSRSIDASQSPPQKIMEGTWVRSRVGAGRSSYRGRP